MLFSEKNNCEFTSFPDFVYAWMGSFCIDEKTRVVREVEWSEKDKCDDFRLQLLLGLQSHRSNTNWESYNFRELIEERYSKDEMYFFLYCRNLLFKGPQLRTAAGVNQAIQYIQFEKIQELVEIVMAKSSDNDRKHLYGKLREYMEENKQPNNSIDSSMVLRVLLEFYLREKKVKVALLESLYKEQPKIGIGSKATITFQSYKRIMEQFDKEISQLDVR